MYSILQLPLFKSLISQRIVLILMGALYPLGFSPFDIWPLTIVSIILLVNEVICFVTKQDSLAMQDSGKKKPLSLFSIGLYWGYGAFGVGASWVYVSIHEYGHAPVVGAIGISFLFVLVLSLVKAGGIYMIGKIHRWIGVNLLVLVIPFCWVIFEFVQTLLFSGFPWLFAGYTQLDGPLWMLSTWLGVYGVSWFLLAICSCLVILLRDYLIRSSGQINNVSRSAVILIILLSVPFLAAVVPSTIIQPEKQSLDVALVQPNIAQEQKWDRQFFSKIVDILYLQSKQHWQADLLVWPEGAIPAYQHQVKDIIEDLDRQAQKSDTDLLLGLPVYYPQQKISYAALIALGKQNQTYHKQVLVPFGEYVPLGNMLRGLIEFFDLPMSSFSPATSEQIAMDFADYQVIPAICYEITYPDIVHDLIAKADQTSNKPKLLVTVSNDAWFGDSLGPYQHMQMARMRALELGIPLVRSTNDGITAVVDARGKMLARLNRYEQATLRYTVPMAYYQTLYRKYGLNGIYLILLLSLVLFTVARFKLAKK